MLNRHRILIVLFLLLMIGPSVLWFLFQPSDYNGIMDTKENRYLAQMPRFTGHTIQQFPEQFDAYFNDHIPFRNKMIEYFAALEYKLFGKSIDDKVIVGEDGWLFYSSPADGNSLHTYKGIDHFSHDEMELIAERLSAARNKMQEKGIDFVVMFPPNKESIYSEYMPEGIKQVSKDNRLDLLVEYLEENTDLRIVYPKEELMKEKNTHPVYYKQDTHWNLLGGYIGSAMLLNELGMNPKKIEELQLVSTEANYCDLRNMGRLDMVSDRDADYNVLGVSEYTASIFEMDADNFIRLKSNNPNGLKLFIQRDSFGTAMMEYLPSFFDESVFVHWRAFQPEMLETEMPDVYVLEIVERSLPLLFNYGI